MADANERALLNKLEAAQPDELAQVISSATAAEEQTLRNYLGPVRFQRMRALVLRRQVRGESERLGNVVAIHGIMGGELTTVDTGGDASLVWVSVMRLLTGQLARLQLSDDGLQESSSQYRAHASGILKRYYGELLLALSMRWNVRAFWFDWRKDLAIAAAELEAQLRAWFPPTAPVHIVAHSMGGLVARTFIQAYPARWNAMRDPELRRGGRLVMLGTPNHGSFVIPRVVTGLEDMVRKIAKLDLAENLNDVLRIVN